jgi:hypothetical protein
MTIDDVYQQLAVKPGKVTMQCHDKAEARLLRARLAKRTGKSDMIIFSRYNKPILEFWRVE